MNDTEIRAQLARALGRPLDGHTERRLAMIFGAVLAGGGPAAEQALVTCCDVYARMLSREHLPPAPPPAPRPPGR